MDTVYVKAVLTSTFLALILTVPSHVIFMEIYFSTDKIVLGSLVGFEFHFVGLVFSESISKGLFKIMG